MFFIVLDLRLIRGAQRSPFFMPQCGGLSCVLWAMTISKVAHIALQYALLLSRIGATLDQNMGDIANEYRP